MAQALEFFFDDDADAAIRALWRRLDEAGVPSLPSRTHGRHRPHVSFAVAGAIPPATRDALRADLAMLSVPSLWLYTLGTFPTSENSLFLAAVTDAELLAVHSAVHDALARRVKQPSAYYLPGAWVPHCTLTQGVTPEQLTAAMSLLHPIRPVRAKIASIGVTDTRTGDIDVLVTI